jgi:hypothetical protein
MTRYTPEPEDHDSLADEDGWSEVVDARVPRVDLVRGPANGSTGFIIMKSQAQKADNPMRPSDYIRGTSILTTAAETAALRKSALRKAAKKADRVAVYDSTGRLIGSVDPSRITALHSASDPNAKPAPTPKPKQTAEEYAAANVTPAPPQQPEDATDGPVAESAQAIAKAMAGAGFAPSPDLVKSGGTDVDARYAALVKSIDPAHRARVGDAVAHSAMVLQFGAGYQGEASVSLAKSIALDLAAVERRRPAPSVEAAAEAMKRARPLR